MDMDDCERFIDAGCEPPTYELPLVEDASPGPVRCGCCGGNSFERIGTGTLAYRLKVIVGFENEVLEFQASDTFAACCDFEPSRYRCAPCDSDDYDLADHADARPWALGARAVLPDGSEARIEAIGPDRIMGRHREPTRFAPARRTYCAISVRSTAYIPSSSPSQSDATGPTSRSCPGKPGRPP
jgi:hypothetical protein